MAKTFADFGIHIRSGATGNVKVTCPKCSSERKKKRDPCLSVNTREGVWNCHNCGWSGSLKSGGDDWRSPSNEWRRPSDESLKLKAKSENGDGEINPLRKFLNDRGIPDEFIEKNKIAFVEERWNFVLGKVAPAIAFPFYRKGELINVKYRGSKKAFSLEKDCELIFWGLDSVVSEVRSPKSEVGEKKVVDTVYVVEGEMDALAMHVAGFDACLSVPNGAPSANVKDFARHFDYIRNSNYSLDGHSEGILEEVKEFVIAVDADVPGQRLEQELVRRFGPERCRKVSWPDGCKDANDVLLAYGVEAIKLAVELAKPPPIAGIFRVEDISDEVDRLYTDGLHPGLSLGWAGLSKRNGKELYTVAPGMLTLISGIPGMGKSAFIEAMTVELAKRYGWRFAVFAPETTTPIGYPVSQIAQIFMRKPFAEGPIARMSPQELEYAKEWVNEHYFWIVPEEEDFGLQTILEKAKVLITRYGVQALVIDPWNNIEVFLPKGMTETMYLRQCLRTLKLFATKHGVAIFIAVHPSKLVPNPKTKKYDVIDPYQLMGGSLWINMMDFIVCVHSHHKERDYNGEPVEFIWQKIKRRHLGALGTGYLHFDVATGNYEDVPNLYADEGEEYFKEVKMLNKVNLKLKNWHDD